MRLMLLKKFLNTQASQVMWYWSPNTFEALKETLKTFKTFKSKHLQTSQISLSTLKSLKSCANGV